MYQPAMFDFDQKACLSLSAKTAEATGSTLGTEGLAITYTFVNYQRKMKVFCEDIQYAELLSNSYLSSDMQNPEEFRDELIYSRTKIARRMKEMAGFFDYLTSLLEKYKQKTGKPFERPCCELFPKIDRKGIPNSIEITSELHKARYEFYGREYELHDYEEVKRMTSKKKNQANELVKKLTDKLKEAEKILRTTKPQSEQITALGFLYS